jgi:2-iminobutanoate/2-iminopropanoate deaminase
MRVEVNTTEAPTAAGPYSQAVRAGDFVFVSGQLPIDPGSGKIVEGFEAQTEQAIANLRAVLEAAGGGLDSVVRAGVFLTNMEHFARVNEIYAQHFTGTVKPARAAYQVGRLPLGAEVEIEATAYIPA